MGGNRKTSSTKGGKYMNPTDQARKEERKKQLKKHKRQREQVREAVIKSKNPNSVLDELAKLDDLEFDAENECPYADRVMQEKRTRMKATYFKVRRAKIENKLKIVADLGILQNRGQDGHVEGVPRRLQSVRARAGKKAELVPGRVEGEELVSRSDPASRRASSRL